MTFHEKVERLRAALDAWGKEAPPTVNGEILLGGAASDLLDAIGSPPSPDDRPMVVWVPKPYEDEEGQCCSDCKLSLWDDGDVPWCRDGHDDGEGHPGHGCPWEVQK